MSDKNIIIMSEDLSVYTGKIFDDCFERFLDDLRYRLSKEIDSGTKAELLADYMALLVNIENEYSRRTKAMAAENDYGA